MSYVEQMGDVSYLGIGPPGFPFVRLSDAAHIAAEADNELAALRQKLAQAENRERLALTEIKTLKNEKARAATALQVARQFQGDVKVWMHFLARDVGTDRQDRAMESFARIADKSEKLQKLLTELGYDYSTDRATRNREESR